MLCTDLLEVRRLWRPSHGLVGRSLRGRSLRGDDRGLLGLTLWQGRALAVGRPEHDCAHDGDGCDASGPPRSLTRDVGARGWRANLCAQALEPCLEIDGVWRAGFDPA